MSIPSSRRGTRHVGETQKAQQQDEFRRALRSLLTTVERRLVPLCTLLR